MGKLGISRTLLAGASVIAVTAGMASGARAQVASAPEIHYSSGDLALGGPSNVVQTAQASEVAQVGGTGGGVSIEAPPVATGREDVFARPERGEDALVVGDWLLYPSAFAGAMYDTNVNQTNSGVASAGLRVAPSLLAQQDSGIFKTTLYGNADSRFYLRNVPGDGTVVSARAGGTETYTPVPDLIFNGQADYTRQQDLFATLGTEQNIAPLNPTGIGLAPTANPTTYNQFTGAASVQKNFARSFLSVGGSVVNLTYDNSSSTVAASPNGTVYTGVARGGFWITPALYGYAEGALDSRNEATNSLSSNGYRVIGGLGTDQIGLMKGEIYAGYQAESYNGPGIGTVSAPVYGVRGHYFPLPQLTLNLSVDESLGASLITAAGGATKVDTYLVTADYAIDQQWGANGRGGYIHTDYVGTGQNDDAWTLGGTVSYALSRNLGLTLDYQHLQSSSNVVGQSFTRDIVTLGATYKY
jgi:hypothetical protein